MSADITQSAKDLLSACEKMSGAESRIVKFSSSLLDTIFSHGINQARYFAVQKAMEDLDAETENFTKNAEKKGMAASIEFMIKSRRNHQKHLSDSLKILDKLLEETDKLNMQLRVLQKCITVPEIATLMQYVSERRSDYEKCKEEHLDEQKEMNSAPEEDAPGAEYGLKPFEEVVYSMDGQVMIWNKEENDWELADDFHPCRKLPGSSWGKFFYDMTPGDFFRNERRQSVEWTHPGLAKTLLDHMVETQQLLRDEASTQNASSNQQKILEKNKKIAAATGHPYPVDDVENLRRTLFDMDMQAVISEPYNKRRGETPSLSELSVMVEEVARGCKAEIKDVQEQEKFEYILPQ